MSDGNEALIQCSDAPILQAIDLESNSPTSRSLRRKRLTRPRKLTFNSDSDSGDNSECSGTGLSELSENPDYSSDGDIPDFNTMLSSNPVFRTTSTKTPPCRCAASRPSHTYNTRHKPDPAKLDRKCTCPSWDSIWKKTRARFENGREHLKVTAAVKKMRDRYANEKKRSKRMHAWPLPEGNKPTSKFQQLNKRLEELGFEYKRGTGDCVRGAILNGFLEFSGQASCLDRTVIDIEFEGDDEYTPDCTHRITATLRDLLLQEESSWSRRNSPEEGATATILCDRIKQAGYDSSACEGGVYWASGLCIGKLSLETEFEHCFDCSGFGKCKDMFDGDLHCEDCGNHADSYYGCRRCDWPRVCDVESTKSAIQTALTSGCCDVLPTFTF